eukprot:NODE_1003_length_1330_cov_18.814988_g829_i0.p1 GENE.NODE_1003_length_1330_cov_18.814988_g829_i0~~NODE_1003_length_1330_cov_18.814988_g829_i0.p1  ORF type:complete len:285 (+),score=76.87 NODE_1003_length_1330_cov_18.814988_g829_i0:397-1251(+)
MCSQVAAKRAATQKAFEERLQRARQQFDAVLTRLRSECSTELLFESLREADTQEKQRLWQVVKRDTFVNLLLVGYGSGLLSSLAVITQTMTQPSTTNGGIEPDILSLLSSIAPDTNFQPCASCEHFTTTGLCMLRELMIRHVNDQLQDIKLSTPLAFDELKGLLQGLFEATERDLDSALLSSLILPKDGLLDEVQDVLEHPSFHAAAMRTVADAQDLIYSELAVAFEAARGDPSGPKALASLLPRLAFVMPRVLDAGPRVPDLLREFARMLPSPPSAAGDPRKK